MAESSKQLKSMLVDEQHHFEDLVTESKFEGLKTKVMQSVDEQLESTITHKRQSKMPALFAIAASLVLTVSIFFYTQFAPTTVELIAQSDLTQEATYIAALTESELVSQSALPMSIDLDAPAMMLQEPADLANIQSPTSLKLLFKSGSNADIDMGSLQFSYGLSGIDITDRIVGNAQVDVDSIYLEKITLPEGNHWITVRIADKEGRESKVRYKFIVN